MNYLSNRGPDMQRLVDKALELPGSPDEASTEQAPANAELEAELN